MDSPCRKYSGGNQLTPWVFLGRSRSITGLASYQVGADRAVGWRSRHRPGSRRARGVLQVDTASMSSSTDEIAPRGRYLIDDADRLFSQARNVVQKLTAFFRRRRRESMTAGLESRSAVSRRSAHPAVQANNGTATCLP